jgi:hypothetical protein
VKQSIIHSQPTIVESRYRKKAIQLVWHGSAWDLGMALECFQGVAEGLGTSLKLFESFV